MAFYPDGRVKWSFDTDHETWTTPVFTNNGLIIFGSEDGYMYALKDEGSHPEEVWRYPEVSKGAWWGTAAVADDGTIIFGSEVVDGVEKGVYYAIRGSAPLARSHWPKMQRDNLNSGLIPKK